MDKMQHQGWSAYATFAMASDGQLGQVADEKFGPSVVEKIFSAEDMERLPCLRRLYLESYSSTLVDMKRMVETT
eukprot:4371638-Amphidinium_carterae.1